MLAIQGYQRADADPDSRSRVMQPARRPTGLLRSARDRLSTNWLLLSERQKRTLAEPTWAPSGRRAIPAQMAADVRPTRRQDGGWPTQRPRVANPL